MLDTNERTITYKRLSGDLEWIEKCDDVRAFGEDVYCLRSEKSNFVYLLINDEIKDSTEISDIDVFNSSRVEFKGKMVFWGYVNSVDTANSELRIYPNTRPLSFPRFGNFLNGDETLISY